MNNDINRIIKDFDIEEDKIIVHFRKGKDCTFDYNINVLKVLIEKIEKQCKKEKKRRRIYHNLSIISLFIMIVSIFSWVPFLLNEELIKYFALISFPSLWVSIICFKIFFGKFEKMWHTAAFLQREKAKLDEFENLIESNNTKEIIETKQEPVALTLNPEPIKYESNMVRSRRR